MTPADIRYREIPLTQGQVAVVDADLFEYLNQWKWYAALNKRTGKFYARRDIRRRNGFHLCIHMHRLVLGLAPEDTQEVDHIEHEKTLLNVRANLRRATPVENRRNRPKQSNNTSGYKGVALHKGSGKYVAKIGVDGKTINLGSRNGAKDAFEELYVPAAKKHHLNFAHTREAL